jgi:hypothetical protein
MLVMSCYMLVLCEILYCTQVLDNINKLCYFKIPDLLLPTNKTLWFFNANLPIRI